ncbi:UNKNOWN [Stylonychia lemnae]|uniref:Uncharacterized protein n=1 Tax=Stylonychia lemnae TaxID=5949 RepID=A0A078AMK2_STYLE|nr:UNKNOWN [Stylonychia lemnae]|eukprot:CDW83615.1 UNKNOWN [Stylonychia lemnae]
MIESFPRIYFLERKINLEMSTSIGFNQEQDNEYNQAVKDIMQGDQVRLQNRKRSQAAMESFDQEFRVFYANSSPKRPYEVSRHERNIKDVLIDKSMQENPFKRLENLKKAQKAYQLKQKMQSHQNSLRQSIDIQDQLQQENGNDPIYQQSQSHHQTKMGQAKIKLNTMRSEAIEESKNHPQSQLWYPAISDFKSHITSDFDKIYQTKTEQRELMKNPPKQNPKLRKTFLIINTDKDAVASQSIRNKNMTLVSQTNIGTDNDGSSKPILIDTSDPLMDGDLLFKFGDPKNYWFDVGDIRQHQMYEANLVQISKRSKFKVYQSVVRPDTSQRVQFVEKCGISSQNKFRHNKSQLPIKQQFLQRRQSQQEMNNTELERIKENELDQLQPYSNDYVDNNKIQSKQLKGTEIPTGKNSQYKTDMLKKIRDKSLQKQKIQSKDNYLKAQLNLKKGLSNMYSNSQQREDLQKQDSFVALFDKFQARQPELKVDGSTTQGSQSKQMAARQMLLTQTGQNKDAPIDNSFMNQLIEVRSNKIGEKKLFKAEFSDKLYMFQQIENLAKDQQLEKKIDELAQRRKKMLQAMEQFEKNNKFK